jgi:hypothetical protein
MRNIYRKDITLVIILKLLALFLLWELFFSHPIEKDLTHDKLVRHLLNHK